MQKSGHPRVVIRIADIFTTQHETDTIGTGGSLEIIDSVFSKHGLGAPPSPPTSAVRPHKSTAFGRLWHVRAKIMLYLEVSCLSSHGSFRARFCPCSCFDSIDFFRNFFVNKEDGIGAPEEDGIGAPVFPDRTVHSYRAHRGAEAICVWRASTGTPLQSELRLNLQSLYNVAHLLL